jgi:hypothetical protein
MTVYIIALSIMIHTQMPTSHTMPMAICSRQGRWGRAKGKREVHL